MAEPPPPPGEMALTHFIVSDDVERSRRFYTEVLGGRQVFGPVPVNVQLANSWIVISTGEFHHIDAASPRHISELMSQTVTGDTAGASPYPRVNAAAVTSAPLVPIYGLEGPGSRWKVQKAWPDSGPGMALNCDVLPLNIKGATRFLRKWPLATLDIEPPEALWPETKGQAASLARVRGHPLHGPGGHRADPSGSWAQAPGEAPDDGYDESLAAGRYRAPHCADERDA
jgi:hypothetical protein